MIRARVPAPMRRPLPVALLVASAIGVAACGSSDTGNSVRAARAPTPTPPGTPPALARNASQADRIIGDAPGLSAHLETLKGYPVVMNQWASWCSSCRFEMPFFSRVVRRYQGKVAFLGLDSQDSESSGRDFLRKYRPGFPSFSDPDATAARILGGAQAWPTTFFLDRENRVIQRHIGAYASAALL